MHTFDIGPIRPPSESASLLLRVTKNCPWNRCRFCTLYKTEHFQTRTMEEIKRDIDAMAEIRDLVMGFYSEKGMDYKRASHAYDALSTTQEKQCFDHIYTCITAGKMKTMFLQDANTIVLKSDALEEILDYVKEKLPQIERITTYGRADTLSRLSLEALVRLRQAGLDRIHSGFETGSDRVLALLDKGGSSAQQIEGGLKVKEAGIALSVYFMPGAGGKTYSEENALETARVIRAIDPDFVRLRTFVIKYGSPMAQMELEGAFVPCTDREKLLEIRLLLEHLEGCHSYLASDQIINLLEGVKGYLHKDRQAMLAYIDGFFSLGEEEQKRFQLARRMGFSGGYESMDLILEKDKERIDRLLQEAGQGVAWEAVLNRYLNRYI